MYHTQRGMTLIELMIAVTILAVLVAIALPQYQRYIQHAANGACLEEARAYIRAAAPALANGHAAPTYLPSACVLGPASLTSAHYNTNASVTFTPRLRGTSAELRVITCQVGSGSCRY